MVAHRYDVGAVSSPVMAGDPLRIDVTARTNSGQPPGSLAIVDLTSVQRIAYALFNMQGDAVSSPAAFTLTTGSGITVSSAAGGQFSVLMTASHTALWRGRDWHTARMTDVAGQPFVLFDGFITSTRALDI